VVRGDEVPAYREEPDVSPSSRIETFVAMRMFVDNWRWGGVPFLLRTGKCLPKRYTSIKVQFRMPPHTLFGSYQECHLRPNALTLRIQPNDGIEMAFEVKEPGNGMVIKPAKLNFDYTSEFKKRVPDAYERLLMDVISGDQSLFIRSDEVETAWKIVDAIRNAWIGKPLTNREFYAAGTWGPAAADDLLAKSGHEWKNPQRRD
jgi:glucose-6-phosphate 1-dehydrogenase